MFEQSEIHQHWFAHHSATLLGKTGFGLVATSSTDQSRWQFLEGDLDHLLRATDEGEQGAVVFARLADSQRCALWKQGGLTDMHGRPDARVAQVLHPLGGLPPELVIRSLGRPLLRQDPALVLKGELIPTSVELIGIGAKPPDSHLDSDEIVLAVARLLAEAADGRRSPHRLRVAPALRTRALEALFVSLPLRVAAGISASTSIADWNDRDAPYEVLVGGRVGGNGDQQLSPPPDHVVGYVRSAIAKYLAQDRPGVEQWLGDQADATDVAAFAVAINGFVDIGDQVVPDPKLALAAVSQAAPDPRAVSPSALIRAINSSVSGTLSPEWIGTYLRQRPRGPTRT